jgi:hypothetical protein
MPYLLKNLPFIVHTNFPVETDGWIMAALLELRL